MYIMSSFFRKERCKERNKEKLEEKLFFFLYGASAHVGPWPPLYEVP
jgi:hypothetical protein